MVRSRFPSVRLATARRNTGGAGGFAYGLALALADAADLVWLMDDDTVPEPGALRAMLDARALHPGGPPALIASRVVWTDGRPHPMNTPRTKPFASKAERAAAAAAGCLPIRSASFVSILVDAGVCRAPGPARRPTTSCGTTTSSSPPGCCAARPACSARPASWCTRPPTFGSTDADPGQRFFYEVRNKVWTLRTGVFAGPRGTACCTAAPRCAAGPARSRSPPTGARSGPA